MVRIFLLFVCVLNCFHGNYSIVFVHIGKSIPEHAYIALAQARLFNPNCSIVLLASEKAIKRVSSDQQIHNITYVPYESLDKTAEHLRFEEGTVLDTSFRSGFWRYTSERFLYLNDFVQQYALMNVFHLEYDNMLYVNLEELLPSFCMHYPGIGATFDNDGRCIPGFLFFANPQAMSALAACFADCAKTGLTDMEVIAKFRATRGEEWIDFLPILPKGYADAYPLISATGLKVRNQAKYYQHEGEFQSLFDGAAFGQYLGGIDPIHPMSGPGFINESCVFNPARFQFAWHQDCLGRDIPYAVFNGREYRLNNLHIHSKDLLEFRSVK